MHKQYKILKKEKTDMKYNKKNKIKYDKKNLI